MVDAGIPRLRELGLIELRRQTLSVLTPGDHRDWQIRLLRDHREGQSILAAVCGPSAFEQLDWLWRSLHEYDARGGGAYFAHLGPEGVLTDGVWYSGWMEHIDWQEPWQG